MARQFIFRLRGLLSEEAFVRAYQRRQAHRPTEGNRTVPTLLLTGFLAFLLFSTVLTVFWVQRSDVSYLHTLSGVAIFPEDALTWSIRRAPTGCDRHAACSLKQLLAAPPLFQGTQLSAFDYAAAKAKGALGANDLMIVSTDVRRELWSSLVATAEAPQGLLLALPALRFETATTYIDGAFAGRLLEAESIAITVESRPGVVAPLRVDLVLKPEKAQRVLFDGERTSDVVFMADAAHYRQYADLVADKASGQGRRLADTARIVLAIFALLLFIFVDGSPECLALATFMSIKALGAAVYEGWMPDFWGSSELSRDLRDFLFCFGDVMKLFFFLQLARIIRPAVRPWLVWGSLASLVYAGILHGDFVAFDIAWSEQIWRWRSILIGVACFTVAVAGAKVCLKRNLYARATAMLVAASGTLVQIVYPIAKAIPFIFQSDTFQAIYFIWDTHTPYVFTLSAFINLSTLERRVKALSGELVQTRETERQRALVDSVRQAHLPLPSLPQGFSLAVYREDGENSLANLGKDAGFVHWQPANGRLAMLVHGFSGGGLAPALKGTACAALGTAVWQEGEGNVPAEARFAAYDQRVGAFMGRAYQGQESAAFVGGELDVGARRLTLFRADGTMPMLVRRGADARWHVEIVPLASRHAHAIDIPERSFLILTNATIKLGGRGARDLVRYLDSRLEKTSDELDVEGLKQMIVTYIAFLGEGRTLVALGMPAAA